ncbi:uncharacterized protein LOC109834785 [Asparagus officinalis]|uniref:uncharacterized protein LOC109834785 n=1 Tax=Asparagus officinalis TaxID=4686 RepID=UPI00098E5D9E|nr:uncharacterized protein LOC109834785 [Asparagus officinalis]
MEYLSRRLNQLQNDRLFRYHPKCKNLKITHLIFADDLLLFAKGDLYSVQRLYQCFKDFSATIGLEANLNKCSIYFGGVQDSVKSDINNFLGFIQGAISFRYLGVPLICKRLSYVDCSPLIDSISNQFQKCLKHKNLSYAGRLQVIKSVILGIQNYWTSNFILPVKITMKMDELCRKFLWGKTENSFKVPLVSWDKVCYDKKYGGLGVFSASIWNLASALRSLWYIHVNKEILWIKWIHGNYLKHLDIWQVSVRTGDSWMWKQLIRVRDKAVSACGGVENLKKILNSCYKNSKIQISAVYAVFSPTSQRVPWFNIVWGKLNYPKHSFVFWLAVQNRLLTQDRLLRRGVINANNCYLCAGAALESHNHLFFDCSFSKEVWLAIMDWLKFDWQACDCNSLMCWYNTRLRGKGFKQNMKRMAISATIYNVWRERNTRFFQQKCRSSMQLVRDIKIDILTICLNNPELADNSEWLLSL